MNTAVDKINERAELGIRLGLACIDRLMKELGSPHLGQKYIHVAGTNGKGSVSAFIASALSEAGYKVGRFSSPKLYDLNDMYSIDGLNIEDERLEELAARIGEASAKLEKEGLKPTEFELQTALALVYFSEEDCDYSLIEVGLGGIEDATNIINPVLSVITGIAFDHGNILGRSLVEIAEKKAGIIKKGRPVCSAPQAEEVACLLGARAGEMAAPYYVLNPSDIEVLHYGLDKTEFCFKGRAYELSQLGTYQVQNAALALLALDVLRGEAGLRLGEEHLREGLKKTYWRSRFELLDTQPLVVLDGAHNEAGIRELRRSIELYFKGRRLRAIFAVMRDKAIGAMLGEVAPYFEGFLLPNIEKERALSNKEVGSLLAELGYEGSVDYYSSLGALSEDLKKAGADVIYVAFGSLYYLEELRRAIYNY